MRVRPNQPLGRHVYLTGAFDRSIVEVLLTLAKPADVLLDVGANIGYISACFLQNVDGSSVISLEPQPKVIDLLRANLEQFGGERYQIFPIGLSDHDSIGWLEIDEVNDGASKVVDAKGGNTVEIELWSARRLFAAVAGRKIDLVKIDAEGHEKAILESCEPYFERLAPRAILFEDHTRSSAPEGAIGSIFTRMGYEVFGISKKLTKLEFIPIKSPVDCRYNDYLATPAFTSRVPPTLVA